MQSATLGELKTLQQSVTWRENSQAHNADPQPVRHFARAIRLFFETPEPLIIEQVTDMLDTLLAHQKLFVRAEDCFLLTEMIIALYYADPSHDKLKTLCDTILQHARSSRDLITGIQKQVDCLAIEGNLRNQSGTRQVLQECIHQMWTERAALHASTKDARRLQDIEAYHGSPAVAEMKISFDDIRIVAGALVQARALPWPQQEKYQAILLAMLQKCGPSTLEQDLSRYRSSLPSEVIEIIEAYDAQLKLICRIQGLQQEPEASMKSNPFYNIELVLCYFDDINQFFAILPPLRNNELAVWLHNSTKINQSFVHAILPLLAKMSDGEIQEKLRRVFIAFNNVADDARNGAVRLERAISTSSEKSKKRILTVMEQVLPPDVLTELKADFESTERDLSIVEEVNQVFGRLGAVKADNIAHAPVRLSAGVMRGPEMAIAREDVAHHRENLMIQYGDQLLLYYKALKCPDDPSGSNNIVEDANTLSLEMLSDICHYSFPPENVREFSTDLAGLRYSEEQDRALFIKLFSKLNRERGFLDQDIVLDDLAWFAKHNMIHLLSRPARIAFLKKLHNWDADKKRLGGDPCDLLALRHNARALSTGIAWTDVCPSNHHSPSLLETATVIFFEKDNHSRNAVLQALREDVVTARVTQVADRLIAECDKGGFLRDENLGDDKDPAWLTDNTLGLSLWAYTNNAVKTGVEGAAWALGKVNASIERKVMGWAPDEQLHSNSYLTQLMILGFVQNENRPILRDVHRRWIDKNVAVFFRMQPTPACVKTVFSDCRMITGFGRNALREFMEQAVSSGYITATDFDAICNSNTEVKHEDKIARESREAIFTYIPTLLKHTQRFDKTESAALKKLTRQYIQSHPSGRLAAQKELADALSSNPFYHKNKSALLSRFIFRDPMKDRDRSPAMAYINDKQRHAVASTPVWNALKNIGWYLLFALCFLVFVDGLRKLIPGVPEWITRFFESAETTTAGILNKIFGASIVAIVGFFVAAHPMFVCASVIAAMGVIYYVALDNERSDENKQSCEMIEEMLSPEHLEEPDNALRKLLLPENKDNPDYSDPRENMGKMLSYLSSKSGGLNISRMDFPGSVDYKNQLRDMKRALKNLERVAYYTEHPTWHSTVKTGACVLLALPALADMLCRSIGWGATRFAWLFYTPEKRTPFSELPAPFDVQWPLELETLKAGSFVAASAATEANVKLSKIFTSLQVMPGPSPQSYGPAGSPPPQTPQLPFSQSSPAVSSLPVVGSASLRRGSVAG